MKNQIRILTIGALLLSAGCASTKEERCGQYQAVYEAYLATTQGGIREVSQEEKLAAVAAATFLKFKCGWVGTKGADINGIEILQPPAK